MARLHRSPFRRAGARLLTALLPISLAFVAGCDDAPVSTPGSPGSMTVDVTVDPGVTDFEVRADMANGPNGPFNGPLVIRGSNLHYDEIIGALVVDLVIVNEGTRNLPEPITLVFTDFTPDGVVVLDADGDEMGPLALIYFEFENDDALWTPGEESLPRTVSFGVDPGVSIGFTARIEAGMPEGGGRIGGIVWNDANEDGIRQNDEPGVPRVRIVLSSGFGPKYSTGTNAEGRYVFEGLGAGTYTVSKRPRDDLEPTTPTSIVVLLTETDGGVSDFLDADFGCIVHTNVPELEVGDYVHATGDYKTEPHRIVARGIEVLHPDDGPWEDDDDGNDGGEGDGNDGLDGDWPPLGEIRGPVTDIDLTDRALQIMGTWFLVRGDAPDDTTDAPDDTTDAPDDNDGNDGVTDHRALGDGNDDDNPCGTWDLALEDVEVGDRVRARVVLTTATTPDAPHVIVHLKCWNGEREKVRGPIEAIEEGPEETRRLTILHTLVIVTPETEIHDD